MKCHSKKFQKFPCFRSTKSLVLVKMPSLPGLFVKRKTWKNFTRSFHQPKASYFRKGSCKNLKMTINFAKFHLGTPKELQDHSKSDLRSDQDHLLKK